MDKLNFKSYTLDKVFEIKGFFSDLNIQYKCTIKTHKIF